jgi:iron complex outermembrane recepter protein
MKVRSIVRMTMRGGLPPAATLLFLGVSAAAGAQSAQAGASQQGHESPIQLQEIVVTAEKRRQPLMEVPVSVTVVSGQVLEQRHEVDMKDYLAEIPGISVQDGGYGQIDFSIRGVATSPFLAPTTGIEVDGVPIGDSTAAGDPELKPNLDPSDMADIQVLYGPQGTLYGDDAMGGLVEFTTIKPQLDRFSGRVEADGSNIAQGGYGDGERGMVNLPVIEGKLAVRISGFVRHDPGFIDDIESGQHNVNDGFASGGRFDVLWQISDTASLRLNALAQDSSYNGDATEIVTPSYKPVYGDLENLGYPDLNKNSAKYRLYTGTLDIDLGWAHLLSLSGYNTTYFRANLDITRDLAPAFGALPIDVFPLLQTADTNKFSQELRLTSPSAQTLEWIAGLYYTREITSEYQAITVFDDMTGGPPTDLPTSILSEPVLNPPTDFHEEAGYLTLTYHFTPKFDLEAGGRYTHETSDFPASSGTGLIGSGFLPANTEADDATTFLAAARYHISQSQMAYVRVASGFRPGGSNGVQAGVPSNYSPDKTTDYELGYKAELLDHRLALETALFYIDWSNVQIGVLNEYDEGFTVNGEKAKSQGAQFTGQYLIGGGLSAQVDLAYTDAALVGPGAPGSGAPAGAQLPFSAKWSGSFSLDEKFPVTARWQGSAQVIYDYFGDRYSVFNSVPPGAPLEPQVFVPAYSTVDLLGGLSDGRYSLHLFVRNLANKRGFSNSQLEGGGGGGDLEVRVITPRTIGLSVAMDF